MTVPRLRLMENTSPQVSLFCLYFHVYVSVLYVYLCVSGCVEAHMYAGTCMCMYMEARGWSCKLAWSLSTLFTGVESLNWNHTDDLANKLVSGSSSTAFWMLELERGAIPTQHLNGFQVAKFTVVYQALNPLSHSSAQSWANSVWSHNFLYSCFHCYKRQCWVQ